MVCVVSMYWSIKTQGFRNHFSGTPTSVCACRLSPKALQCTKKCVLAICFGQHQDIFAMKLSGAGSQLWTFQRGSSADDSATALEIDSYGDLVLAGWTAGSLDGNSNAGSVDLFAMKVDAQGSWEWTFQTGTAREEWAGSLQIIPSGRILLAGSIKNGLGGSDQSAEMTKNMQGMNWSYFLKIIFSFFPFTSCT